MWELSEQDLTEAQKSAVTHMHGPLLILAGPGSGKTRVVTHRIAYLLRQGIPPSQIVALTFTNKAADEMRGRLQQLVSTDGLWISTFHRFCARLLRQYAALLGLSENFTIYDTDDSLRALQQVIAAQHQETSMFSPRQIAERISWAKNHLIAAEDFRGVGGGPISAVVAGLYPKYQQQLLRSAAVDFDDLLMHVATLLHQHPEVRQSLDQRFRYILVDEYQDTNHAQYAILRALACDHPHLAVTGDPDQSIFGWRGANLNNILQFEHDYPSVKIVRLEQNYRSTRQILHVADTLIANNVQRKEKGLYTENEAGSAVRLVSYASQQEEARQIAAEIAAQIRAGRRRAHDFAIFYRVNALSRAVEAALYEQGVSYQLVKGLEFYRRKEIKDVLAYLQLVNNPRDDIAVQRVINTPPRGIGKKTVQRLVEYAAGRAIPLLDAAREAGMIPGMTGPAATRLARFAAAMDELALAATGSVEHIVGLVLSMSGYHEMLRQSDDPADQDRLANIEELLTVARQFDERHPEQQSLELFLEETALISDTDEWNQGAERVTLMTLHSAKGLEFPVVYIIAAEQGLLPHDRSKDNPHELEEERRLLFVGITRAQQQLQISMARFREYRGSRRMTVPSPFLMELPRERMELVEPDYYEMPEFELSENFVADVKQHVPRSPGPAREVTTPQVTTADQLASPPGSDPPANRQAPPAPPDHAETFRVGMAVTHPDYGLGKIAALSGSGAKRTATVNFALSGRRTFRIKESPLRPASANS
ncbi:MAG: UvrD-helicase domain-containing protein [Planctomycetales bacterium]|nr:UvrD-helicase domain-containing protein [Planctomycetales bacterium]NIM10081.1 UvrD-helicase domain-containing protein [Planctomycetales bacterium]NIN09524.1 UvrD-helicase domain-containing protein [Planctomycetales bacterium]NIN78634.1 UvrD-helicase domain-containing protein [Planctomycetales bacterium]NIO35828.1 UvrD-helicase domain-containing protein [Planctomycetales bacterium]